MLTCLLSGLHLFMDCRYLLYEAPVPETWADAGNTGLLESPSLVDRKLIVACYCAMAACEVCLGTLGGEKPRVWETGKAIGMSVMNESFSEETACFDNSFLKLSNEE